MNLKEISNFGITATSGGMDLVLMPFDVTIDDILTSQEYFLDPELPWGSMTHYALKGNRKQYDEVFKRKKESSIWDNVMKKYDFGEIYDPVEVKRYKAFLESTYLPWWMKLNSEL